MTARRIDCTTAEYLRMFVYAAVCYSPMVSPWPAGVDWRRVYRHRRAAVHAMQAEWMS